MCPVVSFLTETEFYIVLHSEQRKHAVQTDVMKIWSNSWY